MFPEHTPKIGDPIIYFDDDSREHHAIVARVLSDEPFVATHTRPRLVISFLGFDGVWRPKNFVEPAYHDGALLKKLNKWCIAEDIELGRLE